MAWWTKSAKNVFSKFEGGIKKVPFIYSLIKQSEDRQEFYELEIAEVERVILDLQDFIFVTGGDLNSVPPSADSTDFCYEDMCGGERFHTDANGGPHKEGSYFENFFGEPDLVQPFYDYHPAINLDNTRDSTHFTHSPWNTSYDAPEYWDRKLDYLFTNYQDWSTTGKTHNDIENVSDHAPVSATLIFP